MRTLAFAAVVAMTMASLAGCNEETDDGDSGSNVEKVETIQFSGTSTTFTVDEDETVNFQLSGTSSTIDIRSDIKEATFSGSGNTITVRSGVSIETLKISSISDLLHLETGVTIGETEYTGSSLTVELPTGDSFPHTGAGVGLTLSPY